MQLKVYISVLPSANNGDFDWGHDLSSVVEQDELKTILHTDELVDLYSSLHLDTRYPSQSKHMI